MAWLWRLWLLALFVVLGWALIGYAYTRKPVYLARARTFWRVALGAGVLALGWSVWRLFRL